MAASGHQAKFAEFMPMVCFGLIADIQTEPLPRATGAPLR